MTGICNKHSLNWYNLLVLVGNEALATRQWLLLGLIVATKLKIGPKIWRGSKNLADRRAVFKSGTSGTIV